MIKIIRLKTIVYIIKKPWRGRYAAVTRPEHDTTRTGPDYTYSLRQLSLRTPLARYLHVR